MKKVIILLTWKRLDKLGQTLKSLRDQTDNDFDVHISNANLEDKAIEKIEETVSHYTSSGMRIKVTHDGNDYSCFRRFFIAKDYSQMGYDVVFFLDDDILIPRFYIKKMMSQFVSGAYHSCYAWNFRSSPQNYWRDRTRLSDNNSEVKYAGAGVSMTDAKLFQDERLFDVISPMAYHIDDLWMSYFCNHVAKAPIVYTYVSNVHIGGNDSSALYKKLKQEGGDQKSLFLQKLIQSGWNL
jgi:glycosyltransferase involved in cell wall biosynthesis